MRLPQPVIDDILASIQVNLIDGFTVSNPRGSWLVLRMPTAVSGMNVFSNGPDWLGWLTGKKTGVRPEWVAESLFAAISSCQLNMSRSTGRRAARHATALGAVAGATGWKQPLSGPSKVRTSITANGVEAWLEDSEGKAIHFGPIKVD